MRSDAQLSSEWDAKISQLEADVQKQLSEGN